MNTMTPGNLTAVKRLVNKNASADKQYETTMFNYTDANYEPIDHYVTGITDSPGITPVQYIYDDLGRLTGLRDAKGRYVDVNHDDVNGQKAEAVTDRYGNTQSIFYNARALLRG